MNRALPCFVCCPTLQPCLYARTITIQELLDSLFGTSMLIRLLKAFQCAQIPTTSVLQWRDWKRGEALGGSGSLCISADSAGWLQHRRSWVFPSGGRCGEMRGSGMRSGEERLGRSPEQAYCHRANGGGSSGSATIVSDGHPASRAHPLPWRLHPNRTPRTSMKTLTIWTVLVRAHRRR